MICVAAHLARTGKTRIAIGAAAPRTMRVPQAEALVEKAGHGAFAEAGQLTRCRRLSSSTARCSAATASRR